MPRVSMNMKEGNDVPVGDDVCRIDKTWRTFQGII
jgi:hypothetical protein